MVNIATNMVSVERAIDGILMHLRNKVHAQGFTQLEVQERLGWGRSYLSQLLTKQKSLRFRQLILVLAVIGVDLEEFFADLYHWPTQSAEGTDEAARPLGGRGGQPQPVLESTEDAEREIDRVMGLVMTKIRERGFTQIKVQERLGWGRNYISHLVGKSKHLRVEQVLAILSALEVDPAEFFLELYRPAEFQAAPRKGEDEVAEVRRELDQLRSMVRLFGRLLVEKGWMAEEEIPPDLADRLRR